MSPATGTFFGRVKTIAKLALAGMAGIFVYSLVTNDKPMEIKPPKKEPEITHKPEPVEEPANPDAGKYMHLALYVDGKLRPYVGKLSKDYEARSRAKELCAKGPDSKDCIKVAELTRNKPGCIAYARDEKDPLELHLNIFHRIEDNKPFDKGHPFGTEYFCNAPELQRLMRDGKTVTPEKKLAPPVDTSKMVLSTKFGVTLERLHLADDHGLSKGDPAIAEGSCVELNANESTNHVVKSETHITAYGAIGQDRNASRSGYVHNYKIARTYEGAYNIHTCRAFFEYTLK